MNNETDNNNKEQVNESKKSIFFLNKKLIRFFKFILIIIIPIVTVYLTWQTIKLTKTTNLLQLNMEIQAKTDIVYDIEIKYNEIKIALRNDETVDDAQINRVLEEKRNAITSLLNTYEIACQYYLGKKIDRDAFKTFYNLMIKYIKEKEDYSHFFIFVDGRETFPAINIVYRKWHME